MDGVVPGRQNLAAVNDLLNTPPRGFGTWVTVFKAAVAASVSFAIAAAIGPDNLAVFAPVVALFTVQTSAYATLAQGMQRVLGTVVGVLFATVWLQVAGTSWWSIGVIVLLSVGAARQLPFAYSAQAQIPIAMLLVVVLGAAFPDYPYWRVVDAAIGGVVGIVVGLLIPERPQLAPARAAARAWVDALVATLRAMADEAVLQATPLPAETRHAFVLRARELNAIAARGRAAAEHARESVAFNPLARRDREEMEALALNERWLVRVTLEIRVLAVTVDEMYDREGRRPRLASTDLARLLRSLGDLLQERAAGTDVAAASEVLALDLSRTVDRVSATPSSDRIPLASISLLGRIDQLRQEVADPRLGPALDVAVGAVGAAGAAGAAGGSGMSGDGR